MTGGVSEEDAEKEGGRCLYGVDVPVNRIEESERWGS